MTVPHPRKDIPKGTLRSIAQQSCLRIDRAQRNCRTHYVAKLSREGKNWLAEFPDCPGCQTFGSSRDEALEMAKDALEGWLEVHLADGAAPPRPRRRKGTAVLGGSRPQAQLAKRVGVSQQQVAKLENPSANPSLATLEAVAKGAGAVLDVKLVA